MVDPNNKYTKMQETQYDRSAAHMAVGDHKEHNANSHYWTILLKDIDHKYDDKKALDFGCGTGRNVFNLLFLADWKQVVGCDISKENIKHCYRKFEEHQHPFLRKTYEFIKTNG